MLRILSPDRAACAARVGSASRLSVPVVAALALFLTGACSERPGARLASHIEAMVALLEEHKETPDQAAEAVESYVERHRETLTELRREIVARTEGLSGDELADLAGELLKDLGPVMERADRLMRAYPKLAEDERLIQALDPIRQALR